MGEDIKQQLIDRLINQIVSDANSGDTTVLEEILFNVPNKVLLHSLPEEEWKRYEKVLNED
jgi:hypothetical protein